LVVQGIEYAITNPPAENELVNGGIPAVLASATLVNIQDIKDFHDNGKTLKVVSLFLSMD
jgi:hypothetical protein